MPRNVSSEMGFPSFRGAVRNLIIANAAIFVVLLLLRAAKSPLADVIEAYGTLSLPGIKHGFIWQFVTYGFIHNDPFNFVLSMLGIYFIGAAVEDQIRSRRFYELYFFSLIGAGAVGVALVQAGLIRGGAIGAGPAANAILMVFYFLYRQAKVMPMFIPIPIPVKYIVIFVAAVEAAYLVLSFSLIMAVQLLGLGAGYVWYTLARRRSLFGYFEDRVASLRNGYYRWKRRRASRKFEVYMRKHQHDPKQYFDEYGNFRPPDEKDKKDKGTSSGGWVN
ncbi:MAG TPA: rhomboid family intramembrane serine protease [Candidatus Angelobacter sp.]|nr:rhomboid family intramembrane serine protease [Candidatus Angelobacter sp.]